MIAATFLHLPKLSAMRKPTRPAPTLADPAATDWMTRQPLSDVPVPSSWSSSSPSPLDSSDAQRVMLESLDYDEAMVGWESAGVSAAGLHPLRQAGPRRIAESHRTERFNMSLAFIFAAVTCSVIGWVALL